MSPWGKDRWMNDDQLFLSSGQNCSLTFGLTVETAGKYRLDAYLTYSPEFGRAQVLLDGTPVGEPIDFYGSEIMPTGAITLGTFDLTKKVHSLTFKVVGKDDRSHYYSIGLDCFSMVPVP
jgi:hypothetical protein